MQAHCHSYIHLGWVISVLDGLYLPSVGDILTARRLWLELYIGDGRVAISRAGALVLPLLRLYLGRGCVVFCCLMRRGTSHPPYGT